MSQMLNNSACSNGFIINDLKTVITRSYCLETNNLFLEGQRKLILKPFGCFIDRMKKHPLSITDNTAKNQCASEVQVWTNT